MLTRVHDIIIHTPEGGCSPRPSAGEQTCKLWSMYTVGHYSASKRKEILTQATAGWPLEDVMLSESKPDTEGQTLSNSTHVRSLKESDP